MSKYSVIAPNTKDGLKKHFGSTYDYINKEDTVLDVGCSTGYYARLLTDDKGCTVDGIEIDFEDRKEAKKHLRNVFDVDLDSEIWPKKLTSNKYNVIFLGDVIEHVKDASSVLQKLAKILEEDGIIIISTPNIAHITTRLELMGGNFEYEKTGILDETHLKYFTLRSLRKIINDLGFSIVNIDYSSNELHPDTVAHQLSTVGLKPTKKFWEMIKKPEAQAYQWKVVIKKEENVNNVEPILKPMENNFWYLGQVDDLNKSINSLRSMLDSCDKKISALSTELTKVKTSIGWRIEQKLRSIFLKK